MSKPHASLCAVFSMLQTRPPWPQGRRTDNAVDGDLGQRKRTIISETRSRGRVVAQPAKQRKTLFNEFSKAVVLTLGCFKFEGSLYPVTSFLRTLRVGMNGRSVAGSVRTSFTSCARQQSAQDMCKLRRGRCGKLRLRLRRHRDLCRGEAAEA